MEKNRKPGFAISADTSSEAMAKALSNMNTQAGKTAGAYPDFSPGSAK